MARHYYVLDVILIWLCRRTLMKLGDKLNRPAKFTY